MQSAITLQPGQSQHGVVDLRGGQVHRDGSARFYKRGA